MKYNIFTTKNLINDYGVSRMGALDWLHNKEKEGFVERLKITKCPINWRLTDKALKLANSITDWQNDLDKLKKDKKIYDSNKLLKSLKTKFK